jgi:hypothetical protein
VRGDHRAGSILRARSAACEQAVDPVAQRLRILFVAGAREGGRPRGRSGERFVGLFLALTESRRVEEGRLFEPVDQLLDDGAGHDLTARATDLRLQISKIARAVETREHPHRRFRDEQNAL